MEKGGLRSMARRRISCVMAYPVTPLSSSFVIVSLPPVVPPSQIRKLILHPILSRARSLPPNSHCQPAEALKLRYGGQTRPTSRRIKRARERSHPLRGNRMASTEL